MNGLEKIKLLDKIAIELQSSMTFSDIDNYFRGHGVPTQDSYPHNSKRSYAKDMLAMVDESKIFTIAGELGLVDASNLTDTLQQVDVGFWKPGHFRLFLSHLASFKIQTSHLQTALRKFAISSFVAHEDIEPTKEWQNEIEAGLKTMDALAAILMPGFQESKWCDQEIGVAIGRDVLIIPIRKGLDPYGFIGKYQGIQANGKTIGEVAEAIFGTLVKSPKTKNKILLSLAGAVSNANSVEEAIEKISIFKTLEGIPISILDNLKQQVMENQHLIESKDFLRDFNSMLYKFNIQKLVVGKIKPETEWDDIPF
ncbi:TPA: toll/interleukin-1 receptor domain-containing protein [Klebsiella pneumoniae]|uniref:toll/interleukin-1 receptor domain-containing protein n=1 Tax=Klebsiella pneumoniae TaxID=573 RepID=UPI001F4BAD9E|nr:toll/interleukin-1 receptor domain-containing protein [Klebsiella pneumoniae]HBR0880162.1 toll/interleukin-1 receptor domain-containing protein [Klebsiella pneumoniae]HBW7755805.1 toll/interleukin-1 receptor domain-containing protein [Klebsiella pneumoniae]HBX7333549.1 toll/interleukin-1 receptor domain-containing protein [Klebsiella pneumoniae]HBX7410082.1 toll/interleukin-1 receptor domain-containing protein [Klebsiella pneumoniae]HBX7420012.1 toll/interleukin-1 receptor domain-containing